MLGLSQREESQVQKRVSATYWPKIANFAQPPLI